MRSLIRAEIRKLTTTRTSLGLAIGAALVAGLATASAVSTRAGHAGATGLHSIAGIHAVLGAGAAAEIFALVLGVLIGAGEHRWRTELLTYVLEPRRGPVVVAKVIVAAITGVLLSVVTAAVMAAVALPMCSAHGLALPVLSGTGAGVLGGIALASAGYAVIGVAIGSVVSNQAAAVVGALLWALVAENGLLALVPAVGRWLPGGAAAGLAHASLPYGGTLISPAAGLAAMTAYAVALTWLAVSTVTRRDIV